MDIKSVDISRIYDYYSDDIKLLNSALSELSGSNNDMISNITNHIILSGGKRFRPLITIVCANLCGVNSKEYIKLAAAVEYIHTATLLHDDVIDSSSTRRGIPTANSIWGNKAAILSGDFLFSKAFCLMVESGSLKSLDCLSKASTVISEGEMMQLVELGNINLTVDKYLKIIRSKTAELFSAAAEVAVLVDENAVKYSSLLASFGFNLGIAFQIIDDLLDYTTKQTGKNIGDDFYEGKVTLPLIFLLKESSDSERDCIYNIFNESKFNKESLDLILDLLDKYDIYQKSIDYASSYVKENIDILSEFHDSEMKNHLMEINYFAISRFFA